MIIINLIQNISILIALIATYQVIGGKLHHKNYLFQIIVGFLFGGVGIIGMMTPVNFAPGIIFDGRSIVLSVAGLFGGPVIAIISSAICAIYRYSLGGAGAWVGICVIIESSAVGVIFFYWRQRSRQPFTPFTLWIFGMLVHLIMLALMIKLPGGAGYNVISQIGLPIIIFYPIATMLICQIFLDYEKQQQTKKALRESEAKYKDILNNISEMIYVAQDGIIKFITPSVTKITGYTLEELSSQPFTNFLHIEDRAYALEQHYKRLSGINVPSPQYYRIIFKSGDIHWVSLSAALIEWDEKPATLNFLTDITERRRSEEALNEIHSLYQKAIILADAVPYIRNFISGTYSFIGEDIIELTGYSAKEFSPKIWDDITLEGVMRGNLVGLSMEEALHQAYSGKITQWKMDCRIRTKNGEERWISDSAISIFNPQGILIQSIGILQNITDRKKSEEKLSQIHRLYRQAITQADAVPYQRNYKTNQYEYIGKEIENLIGYSVEEINPSMWVNIIEEEIYYGELAGLSHKEAVKRTQTGVVSKWSCDLKIRTKSGHLKWISDTSVQLVDANGTTYGSLGILQDITKRKRAEEEREKLQLQLAQARKMESIGRLAGGVAHDFNNMLQAIQGYCEIASSTVLDSEPVYGCIKEIKKAAERSADLTRQLLAFARKQAVMPKVLDLNKTIEGMLNMLQRIIGENISLVWLPSSNLWKVKIDPIQIDQILANLSINARDAITGVGKIIIKTENITFDDVYCSYNPDFTPGEYVLLSVNDNGCGMDEETLSHIFEPFYTTKGMGEGTGLGLATIYGIIKQNGGFINVYSEIGWGSIFKIYLPRFKDNIEETPTVAVENNVIGGKETILLVEDEIAILNLGKEILEKLGYVVLSANMPSKAISLAEEHHKQINLLITDVVMPEMTGRELSERLTSKYPNIKTIYMSGYTADIIAFRGVLEEGMNFIEKPFTFKDLALKIRKVLDTR